ncbi:M48 family metallopeptidase [Halospeciosus flavus]|uniref:M48 family metallopeptidase n=1 Tax=Halospeciosus flavus TaxID=3032283 RepID=A0ABD5Z5R9_9EURY
MALVGSILFAFYAVAVVAAMAIWGTGILPLAILGSIALVAVQYKVGKWSALRSVKAEDLDEQRYSEIHDRVEQLSRDMGIEKPRLMKARMGVPNAFAVGRKGAGVVVISEELMHLLERDELEGVIAHELAHIKNRDVVMMVLGQGVASVVAIVAQWAVLMTGENDLADFFLAIVVGNLVQMVVMVFVLAISRYREYVADEDARQYIGSGDPLARALEKISRGNQATQHHGREEMVDRELSALCIFDSSHGFLSQILATHPPVEKRIERLRS